MNEERIREFFSDEVFVKELLEQESLEQVQALLIQKGYDVPMETIVKSDELIKKHMKGEINLEELSEDDLNAVSGGVAGTAISIALGVISIVISAAAWVDTDQRSKGRRW